MAKRKKDKKTKWNKVGNGRQIIKITKINMKNATRELLNTGNDSKMGVVKGRFLGRD